MSQQSTIPERPRTSSITERITGTPAETAAQKAAKMAHAHQLPLSAPAKLKPILQGLARSIAHAERCDRYNDGSTLQKQFQAILGCDKSEARTTVDAAKYSMAMCQRKNVEGHLAEREFTYAILRLEDVVKNEPDNSPLRKNLKDLKALRVSYAQRDRSASDAQRGWIELD